MVERFSTALIHRFAVGDAVGTGSADLIAKAFEALVGAGDDAPPRTIALYGYVRGTHLKPSTKLHLLGAGDFFGEVALLEKDNRRSASVVAPV